MRLTLAIPTPLFIYPPRSTAATPLAAFLGATLSAGVAGGIQFTAAHELLHGQSRVDRLCAGALLAAVGYMHWSESHLAHHVKVCQAPLWWRGARGLALQADFWVWAPACLLKPSIPSTSLLNPAPGGYAGGPGLRPPRRASLRLPAAQVGRGAMGAGPVGRLHPACLPACAAPAPANPATHSRLHSIWGNLVDGYSAEATRLVRRGIPLLSLHNR